jgi:uncharacterized protein (TIGR02246 family)
MRKVSILVMTGMVLGFLAVACQPAGEPEAGEPVPAAEPAMSDEDLIRQVAQDFTAAWGDAKAIGELFAADGDAISLDGQLYSGRDQVVRRYADLFEGIYKDTTVALATTSVRFLQPDVAVVDGSFEIQGMKDADGNDIPTMTGMYMNVAVKEGDRWLIQSSRPMIPVKVPETT